MTTEREMDAYRRESGIHIMPQWVLDLTFGGVSPSARDVIFALFNDPRRPVDTALFETVRTMQEQRHAHGATWRKRPSKLRLMTWKTFQKALGELRSMGVLDGDRVSAPIVRGWESEWRKAKREGLRYEYRRPATPEGGA
jgi:hypothetical protein